MILCPSQYSMRILKLERGIVINEFTVLLMMVVKESSTKIFTLPNTSSNIGIRFLGLDALRGIAIIGMVFSGLFPHEAYWPGWMFHAQVGPPKFVFNGEVPGITWVDLVFPFFLFAMGAAFPLAMTSRLKDGKYPRLITHLFKRSLLLVFFAIVIRYLNPAWLQGERWVNLISALGAFLAFFLIYTRGNGTVMYNYVRQCIGFAIVGLLIGLHSYYTPYQFRKESSDIIILVLANMAFFGGLIWILTHRNLMLRMGVLVLFGAVWITYQIPGSWTRELWDFHPSLSWIYRFAFLKYLCVVLPGTVLGELLLKYAHDKSATSTLGGSKRKYYLLGSLSVIFVIFNLYTLYTRKLHLNLAGNALLALIGFWLFRISELKGNGLYKSIFGWGVFFVALGLFFEPFEGGIKKDPSSFSYWLLTSGLSFVFYIGCDLLTRMLKNNPIWMALIKSGQNPMIAYVTNSFFLIPILGLTHVLPLFDQLREIHDSLGIVKAIVLTSLVVLVTKFCTDRRWFWKT